MEIVDAASCESCFARAPKPACLPGCDRDAIFGMFNGDEEARKIWRTKERQLWYWFWRYRSKNEHWVVAKENGIALGTIHWRVRSVDGYRNLSDIVVSPEARGRGIGKLLVEHIGFPIILKTDAESAANGFYLHLGFTEYDRSESGEGKLMVHYYREK